MSYLEEVAVRPPDGMARCLYATHDLSVLNTKKPCDSIDDWLDVLDQSTEGISVLHSTGTGGELSLHCRAARPENKKIMVTAWRQMFERFRDEPPRMGAAVEQASTIFVQYRKGAWRSIACSIICKEYVMYSGDAHPEDRDDESVPLQRADAASIGGRLRVAQAKGELRKTADPRRKLMAQRRDAFPEGAGAVRDLHGRHFPTTCTPALAASPSPSWPIFRCCLTWRREGLETRLAERFRRRTHS